jgi:hypothetical protein
LLISARLGAAHSANDHHREHGPDDEYDDPVIRAIPHTATVACRAMKWNGP